MSELRWRYFTRKLGGQLQLSDGTLWSGWHAYPPMWTWNTMTHVTLVQAFDCRQLPHCRTADCRANNSYNNVWRTCIIRSEKKDLPKFYLTYLVLSYGNNIEDWGIPKLFEIKLFENKLFKNWIISRSRTYWTLMGVIYIYVTSRNKTHLRVQKIMPVLQTRNAHISIATLPILLEFVSNAYKFQQDW